MRQGKIKPETGYFEGEPVKVTLDNKGRFHLPVCFRREDFYYFVSGEEALLLYPQRYYDERTQELLSREPTCPERLVHSSEVITELKGKYRLQIPINYRRRHNLQACSLIDLLPSIDCLVILPGKRD